jgi:hypothetical protein
MGPSTVDEPQSLLARAGTPLIALEMQPCIQHFGWTETFPFLGEMAADARNVRACGWQAKPPLPIDKSYRWEALQTTCMCLHDTSLLRPE